MQVSISYPAKSVIFGLLLVCIPFIADAADVSGTLSVNNKMVKVTHGYVDMMKPDEPIIVLSDKPLPADQIPFLQADYAEKNKVHAVVFGISVGEKKLHSAMKWVYFGGDAEIPFAVLHGDNVLLVLKQLDGSVVDGKIGTPHPVTLTDLTYSFDVSFSLSLKEALAAASAPKQVSFTGDESSPVMAYREYYRAVMGGNVDTMKKYLTAQALREFEAFDAKEREIALELLKMRPENLKVRKPDIAGDRAFFTVEGTEGSAMATGSITMIREGGIWKVLEDKWKVTSK
jgi:hypothetical protein